MLLASQGLAYDSRMLLSPLASLPQGPRSRKQKEQKRKKHQTDEDGPGFGIGDRKTEYDGAERPPVSEQVREPRPKSVRPEQKQRGTRERKLRILPFFLFAQHHFMMLAGSSQSGQGGLNLCVNLVANGGQGTLA